MQQGSPTLPIDDDLGAAEADRLPAAAEIKTDSLAASVVVLLVLTIVQRGVGFLRGVLFCRWLDAEQLGQWDLAYGVLMLAAPLVVLGLPGSFGRYVEYHAARGQLRTFLRRVTLCTLLLAAAATVAGIFARQWLAEIVFGGAAQQGLVLLMSLGLGAVIAQNYLTSLYTALRQVRLASLLQFANGILFAVLGVGMLLAGWTETRSLVIAFCAACLITSAGSLVWFGRVWRAMPTVTVPVPHGSFWAKLLPFAFWLWLTNWLSNLFGIADRVMLVHLSGLEPAAALGLVGQYHTARLFPLLLLGVADLVANVITPHLSADWEAGDRRRAAYRLRLILKLVGLGLTAVSIAVLCFAPLLFNTVWQHRFSAGLNVLPWALLSAVWGGLVFISYNYFWCAERSRLITVALGIGLAANMALNLAWLPWLGLLGAVWAMAASQAVVLALLWAAAHRLGLGVDRPMLVVATLPLLLPCGPAVAAAGLLAVAAGMIPALRCFDADERAFLRDKAEHLWEHFRPALARRKSAAE